MKTLYVAKSFGRYHFFKTAELREQYLKSLPEWEAKHAECYTQTIGLAVK